MQQIKVFLLLINQQMHLDEGIKALKAGYNQGALMHFGAADQALGGSGG
jgi:hypothetical protein